MKNFLLILFITSSWLPVLEANAINSSPQSLQLTPATEQQKKKIALSAAEQDWINAHPKIQLGFNPDMQPLVIVGDDGSLSGILVDIYNELEALTGLKVRMDINPWFETVAKVKKGELDGLLLSVPALAESIGLNTTQPISEATPTIYAKIDAPFEINAVEDLIGKKVAVLKGVFMIEQALAPYKDKVEIIQTNSALEMLGLVLAGKVDVAFGLNYENYLIGKRTLVGIEAVYFASDLGANAVSSIRKDWPEFISIINKGINAMGPARLNAIANKWTLAGQKRAPSLVNLTLEEKAWLEEDHTVRIRVTQWPPYTFNSPRVEGLSIDYWELFAERFGITVEYWKTDMPFSKSIKDLMEEKKYYDLHIALARTPERLEKLAMSQNYFSAPWVIISTKGRTDITTVKDLEGKVLALEKSYAIADIVKENYPKIDLKFYKTSREALESVALGQADAYIGNFARAHYDINNYNLVNLHAIGKTPFGDHQQAIGVRKDWAPLATLFDKWLNTLSQSEHNALLNKWITLQNETRPNLFDQLTEQEKAWLKERPVINLANSTAWPPFGFVENNTYTGIAADYMKLLEKRLGVQLQPVIDKPWKEVLKGVKKRELDVFSCAVPTPSRKEYMSFTKPYLSYPMVIATHDSVGYLASPETLKDRRVAVIEGSVTHDLLKINYPEIVINPMASPQEGLSSVSRNESFAYVGNLATITYIINNKGFTNLKVSGSLPLEFALSMGVRSDWPILVSILQKGLDSITEVEKNAIYEKWIPIKYEPQFDYQLLWIVISIFISMMTLLIVWNRYIQRQRKELQLAKQAAEDAMNKVRMFQMLASASGQGIGIGEHDGEIIYSNPALLTFLGQDDIQSAKQHKLFDYYDEQSQQKLKSDIFPTLMEREQWVGELALGPINGETRPTLENFFMIKDEDGNALYVGDVITDISQQKKIEQELNMAKEAAEQAAEQARKERDKAQQYLDLAGSIIVALDHEGKVLLINPKGCEVLEGKVDDIVGQHWFNNFVPDSDRELAYQVFQQLMAGEIESAEYFENTIVTINEHEGLIAWHNTLMHDDDGNIIGTLSAGEDITERRKADKDLKIAKEEADRANRVKSNFLANMSHELRTPLNAVQGYAQVLLNDQTLTGKQRKGLTTIYEGGQHLVTLIDDILDFTKMESKIIELSLSATLLRPFLNSIVNIIKPKTKSNVNIVCNIEERVAEAVEIDVKRLRQVLLNLLSNAVKFTTEGHIDLNVELCDSVDDDKEYQCLRFSVEDTGPGINQENVEEIFLPFVQVDVPGQSREGTGLGLSISQQLVMLMGGKINVESIPDNGSRFWFELKLPVTNEKVVTTENVFMQPEGYKGEQKYLLIVDDMQTNREVLYDILIDKGFKVNAVSSGPEALSLVDKEIPDMVLTDLVMPVMDGFELKLALREIPKMRDVPIVAVSASIADLEKVWEAGFDDFIPKPIKQKQLFHVIKTKLGLEWEETITEDIPKDQSLTAPPVDEIESLRQLVVQGRIRRVVDWTNELESSRPECAAFASHVRELADDLDELKILALLDSFKD